MHADGGQPSSFMPGQMTVTSSMTKRHGIAEFIVTQTAPFKPREFAVMNILTLAVAVEIAAILCGCGQRRDTAENEAEQ